MYGQTVRRIVRTGLCAGALAGGVLAVASPAYADSHGCGDNVCVNFAGGATSDVSITAWAYSTTFTGYFTATGPNGYNQSSDTETWQGGQDSDNFTFTVSAAPAGTYCVTATGADGSSFGTACEHIE